MPIRLLSIRTSDAQISKVLIGAVFVVTRTSCSFVLTESFLGVDLMAECGGHKAASDIVRKVWMVTIRLEHAKWTLVRGELGRFYLLMSGRCLFPVSYACRRVLDVRVAMHSQAATLELDRQQR